MGNYDLVIGWQKYETTFRDNVVRMEIRPLKRWAWYMLVPIFSAMPQRNAGESNDEYIGRLSPDEREAMVKFSDLLQEKSAKIFAEHVRNFEGITVNGQPVSFETMSEEIVFGNLCVAMCGKLMEISTLTKESEKNSDGRSVSQTSTESAPNP